MKKCRTQPACMYTFIYMLDRPIRPGTVQGGNDNRRWDTCFAIRRCLLGKRGLHKGKQVKASKLQYLQQWNTGRNCFPTAPWRSGVHSMITMLYHSKPFGCSTMCKPIVLALRKISLHQKRPHSTRTQLTTG